MRTTKSYFTFLHLGLLLLSGGVISVSSFGIQNNQSFSTGNRIFSTTTLRMMEECPEIPTTAQLNPKYDTCIIALG